MNCITRKSSSFLCNLETRTVCGTNTFFQWKLFVLTWIYFSQILLLGIIKEILKILKYLKFLAIWKFIKTVFEKAVSDFEILYKKTVCDQILVFMCFTFSIISSYTSESYEIWAISLLGHFKILLALILKGTLTN